MYIQQEKKSLHKYLICVSTTTTSLVAFRQEIENACAAIPLDTLTNVTQAVVGHTHKYLEANGHQWIDSFHCHFARYTVQ